MEKLLLNERIYFADRICGETGTELSSEMYRYWGSVIGSALPEGAKFLVAHDVRESSQYFSNAFLDGLCDVGLDAVDLGTLPTPMVYYAMNRTAAAGGAVVTADDAPASRNGLRWRLNRSIDEQLTPAMLRGYDPQKPRRSTRSRSRTLDVTFDYVAWYQETWFDTPVMPLHVILDPMHGSWSCKVRRYLQAIFPGMIFNSVHDEPCGRFRGRVPSGYVSEELGTLSREVDRCRADVGFVFDADGGRVTMIDGNGVPLLPEEVAWLLLDTFGDTIRGETVLHDSACSRLIVQRLLDAGVHARCVPHGNGSFFRTMRESGAAFGIESGGLFHFRCLRGETDPLFTTCWVLDHLASWKRKGVTLSRWRSTIPGFAITPELSLALPEMQPLLESLFRRLKTEPVRDEEGHRFQTDDGWVYLREPMLPEAACMRIEGTSRRRLDSLLRRTAAALDDAGYSGQKIIAPVYY